MEPKPKQKGFGPTGPRVEGWVTMEINAPRRDFELKGLSKEAQEHILLVFNYHSQLVGDVQSPEKSSAEEIAKKYGDFCAIIYQRNIKSLVYLVACWEVGNYYPATTINLEYLPAQIYLEWVGLDGIVDPTTKKVITMHQEWRDRDFPKLRSPPWPENQEKEKEGGKEKLEATSSASASSSSKATSSKPGDKSADKEGTGGFAGFKRGFLK